MEKILSYIESNHERYLAELKELLAIPSVSSQTERKPEMRRAAEWLKNHMTKIGMQNVQILETEGHPVVYADWLGATGNPTILVYGHYDVESEDPVSEWKSPPYEAAERSGNLILSTSLIINLRLRLLQLDVLYRYTANCSLKYFFYSS